MKRKLVYFVLFICCQQGVNAQKYFTKEGNVSFFSEAPMENIEAHNSKATAVLDMETGRVEWAILIKAFNFKKALMQEHFNENYMESSKFPKAVFKGAIKNWQKLDLNNNQTVELDLEGSMTIHGVTREITTPASFIVLDGQLSGKSKFTVLVQDYDIEIPSVVRDKIAKEILVTVDASFIPLKNN